MFRFSKTALVVAALMSSMPAFAADEAEKGLRCTVPVDAAVYSRNSGAIGPISKAAPVRVRTGALAPALMVEGWSPRPGPLSAVLGALGEEAGFAVTGTEGLGPVSWSRPAAPLSDVLDDLTAQVGASWSFSSGVVHVTKTPPAVSLDASIALPNNRDLTLALLDTLRGFDAANVRLDGGKATFSTTQERMPRIESGIREISEVHAFDVSFYEGRPAQGRYAWNSLRPANSVAEGAGGKFLVPDGAISMEEFLAAAGDVRNGGVQTVAGPAGWALVVPQSQCGASNAELTLRPKRVTDGFSLQVAGSGMSYDIPTVQLGQTLVLASKEPVSGWIKIVTIKPRIVSVR